MPMDLESKSSDLFVTSQHSTVSDKSRLLFSYVGNLK